MRIFAIGLLLISPALGAAGPTTYDGKYDISTINLTVVYFVPKDRKPLPDWKDRVDYYLQRVTEFHKRELGGISQIKLDLPQGPLISGHEAKHFRRGNQDRAFFDTMDDVRGGVKWKPDHAKGFPVLLVLSDINWRELDDFRRVRLIDGKEVHEGNLASNGRHFPGAESGGSRAIYQPDPGYGMGLVSADGWRVPYSGSDCVIYHEGLGHSIGLPHPEPMDNTVMGTAQYEFWINQARLNLHQKSKLGWKQPEAKPDLSKDLFSNFTALQKPLVPKAGEPVALDFHWPEGAKIKSLTTRVQTELFGNWETIPIDFKNGPPVKALLKSFDKPTPVSYRVDAMLEDGQKAEIRGYFQVKP